MAGPEVVGLGREEAVGFVGGGGGAQDVGAARARADPGGNGDVGRWQTAFHVKQVSEG